MKICWTTDLHLNFCSDGVIQNLLSEIKDSEVSALLMGGDIGEADSFDGYLKQFADELHMPIYLVLGNHDAYHGSVEEVQNRASILTDESEWLHWLPESGIIELTSGVCLIGQWGSKHFRWRLWIIWPSVASSRCCRSWDIWLDAGSRRAVPSIFWPGRNSPGTSSAGPPVPLIEIA